MKTATMKTETRSAGSLQRLVGRMLTVNEVREGWHAPGYRDPELHLVTDEGEIHVRLTPQAFVELHNALCMQQGCIDDNGHAALDVDVYPFHTTHVATLRRHSPNDQSSPTAADGSGRAEDKR